jgi:catechol 2,3-dioxygenase-like lactoylglutathione lyase family enzyme
MVFRIVHIDHLVLRVRDVERMVGFYRDVLGCGLEKVQEKLGLWQLRAGGSLIDLVDLAGPLGKAGGAAPGKEGRNVDHFCLRVEPWDEASLRAHLARHDVAVGEAGRRYGADGEGPSIYVGDPEGNTVELKGPPFA